MPLPSPPLDTRVHVRRALLSLRRLDREEWPRVLGAAVAYDMITSRRARELLVEANKPAPWWCTACNSSQSMTCPWCEADACASCWRCVTPGCGEDMPTRKQPPKVVTGRVGRMCGIHADTVIYDEAMRMPAIDWGNATLYISHDGQAWEPIGTTEDFNFTISSDLTVRLSDGEPGVDSAQRPGTVDPVVLASGAGYSSGWVPVDRQPRAVTAWARARRRRGTDTSA